jgi:hypothetical protein
LLQKLDEKSNELYSPDYKTPQAPGIVASAFEGNNQETERKLLGENG